MTADELIARLRLPVIVAPMFLVTGVELVLAACRSGVVGAIPALNARTTDIFADWVETFRTQLGEGDAPYAINLVMRSPDLGEHMRIIEDAQTPVVITSVGDPTPVVPRIRDWGGIVLADVVSVAHARKAAAAGVDGLILVCAGAGGHTGTLTPLAFAREVRRFFDGLLVIAGGISDGAGLLAVEALGAELSYMGSLFISAQESLASEEYRAILLNAQSSDILYTDAISGLPANFIRQSIERVGLDPKALPPRRGVFEPDIPPHLKAWRDIWSAGHGVGLIETTQPVRDIVDDLAQDYDAARLRMRKALGPGVSA